MQMNRKQAFTLIELMVVVSVITILMLATFKLLQAAATAKKVAETRARMERIQNALSGYFAAYGQYPPVPAYCSLDPRKNTVFPDMVGYEDKNGIKTLTPGRTVGNGSDDGDWESRAQLTARYYQPIAFQYPTPQSWDKNIPLTFADWNPAVQAVNQVRNQVDAGSDDWTSTKVFKFGLLAFLLPRSEIAGVPSSPTAGQSDGAPHPDLFVKKQWISQSFDPTRKPGELMDPTFFNLMRRQRAAENIACAKWLPHLQKTLSGVGTVLGIDLHCPGESYADAGLQVRSMKLTTGNYVPVAMLVVTATDAWHHDFYYYSAPPYTSYRIWSAGPNGQTYPPWIASNEGDYIYNGGTRRSKIVEWTKDDIVGGSL